MTEPLRHPIANTQIGLLIGYGLRVWRFVPVALVAAVIVAGIVEAYRRATQSTVYLSETVAIVRPQAAFRSTPQTTVINYLNNPERDAEFLPEPLSVVDYELLVKTQDVLEAVADTYNKEHGGNLTVGALRGYLQPVTKLELRTPYEVRYYATMQLRVQAPSAELAHDLAAVWADEAAGYCQNLTLQVKQSTLDYVTNEYNATLERMQAMARDPNSRDTPTARIEAKTLEERASRLAAIQTEAKLALANDVPEFMIASTPTPAVAQVRGWPGWAAGVAFVLTALALVAAAMLWCIVADVRAAMNEQPPAAV